MRSSLILVYALMAGCYTAGDPKAIAEHPVIRQIYCFADRGRKHAVYDCNSVWVAVRQQKSELLLSLHFSGLPEGHQPERHYSIPGLEVFFVGTEQAIEQLRLPQQCCDIENAPCTFAMDDYREDLILANDTFYRQVVPETWSTDRNERETLPVERVDPC